MTAALPEHVSTKPATTPRTPFHGWRMVAFAAVVLGMSAPAQTAGVSPFIDPVIDELKVSRSMVSGAYLVGTLLGALALPYIGRLIDRYGARLSIAVLAGVFGAVLVGLSAIGGVVALTIGFVGLRLTGQGALGVAAATLTAHWFTRRRGTALGIMGSVGAASITLMPILMERVIAHEGWRTAWLLQGIAVWAILIPIAAFGIRNYPRDVGQSPDGDATTVETNTAASGMTRAEALRTPFFWVLATGAAAAAMLVTAVTFHQISLLTERGLSTAAAAGNFLPQTVAGLAATLGVGWLIDRYHRPQMFIIGPMIALAAGLAWALVVTPGWSSIGYGIMLGGCASAMRATEAAITPQVFGTAHHGAIRGTLTSIAIGSTAFGPFIYGAVHDMTGSYTSVLMISLALPAAVVLAALVVRVPSIEPAPTQPM